MLSFTLHGRSTQVRKREPVVKECSLGSPSSSPTINRKTSSLDKETWPTGLPTWIMFNRLQSSTDHKQTWPSWDPATVGIQKKIKYDTVFRTVSCDQVATNGDPPLLASKVRWLAALWCNGLKCSQLYYSKNSWKLHLPSFVPIFMRQSARL